MDNVRFNYTRYLMVRQYKKALPFISKLDASYKYDTNLYLEVLREVNTIPSDLLLEAAECVNELFKRGFHYEVEHFFNVECILSLLDKELIVDLFSQPVELDLNLLFKDRYSWEIGELTPPKFFDLLVLKDKQTIILDLYNKHRFKKKDFLKMVSVTKKQKLIQMDLFLQAELEKGEHKDIAVINTALRRIFDEIQYGNFK